MIREKIIREKIAPEFYIEDHALIYGLMGKYADELYGEAGLAALEKGTILYARERGIYTQVNSNLTLPLHISLKMSFAVEEGSEHDPR